MAHHALDVQSARAMDWNAPRLPADARGHYESWFLRANHPTRPLAFWVRYTLFRAEGRPDSTRGERWAIWFDGEKHVSFTLKDDVPFSDCVLAKTGLDVKLGDARLDANSLSASLKNDSTALAWELQYAGDDAPMLVLPEALYDARLPRAKVVVPRPNVTFEGWFELNGERIDIDGWRGSQNHNWGSRHTDTYSWAQVCGFDDAPTAFFEAATAQLKFGPVWTPRLTTAVLQLDGARYFLNTPMRTLRAKSRRHDFDWRFETGNDELELSAQLQAPREAFISLPYENPPGGTRTCLNSKLATCALHVKRRGMPLRTLRSAHRAAFEILS